MASTVRPPRTHSAARLYLLIALFVLAAVPLTGYLWETLNQVLSLHVEPRRLVLSVPVAALLAGLFHLMRRTVSAWGPGGIDDT